MTQDADPQGQTIAARFANNMSQHPELTALRYRAPDGGYRELRYTDYADRVARAAAGLAARGFGPGQRLMLMLRNRPEFHILDMAAYFLGGTPLSIYNSSAAEQIRYLAEHSEATFAIVDDLEFLDRLQAGGPYRCLQHIGVVDGEAPPGVFDYTSLLDHAPIDLERAAQTAQPDDLATLIYTSGTTGPPKAVMHTHRGILWTCDRTRTLLQEGNPHFSDGFAGVRVLSYLPMAHIAERMNSHYLALPFGLEVTCCPDFAQLGLHMREVQPQIFAGVPRVWEKLYAGVQAAVGTDRARAQMLAEAVAVASTFSTEPQDGTASAQDRENRRFLDEVAFKKIREQLGLDEVIVAATGAAPLPREIQDWFRAIGVPLSDIYGLSECCGPMTWTPFAAKPGTVGKALPGVEVKLADDGEILCRGGNVFVGYLKDPEQTQAAVDEDGWLHTGDLGALDAEGYLRVVDRKKELLITAGGDNISPANLEGALKSIPLIGQACVVGDHRPYPAALLVLDADMARAWARDRGIANTSLAELAQHPQLVAEVTAGVERVMEVFGRVERVKRFAILDDEWLPDSDELTPTGKLKRRVILDKYRAEIRALYNTRLH